MPPPSLPLSSILLWLSMFSRLHLLCRSSLTLARPLIYITVHVEAMDGTRYFAVAKVELDGTQTSLVAVTRLSCTLPTRPDLAAVRMCLTEAAEDEPVIAVVHWRGTVLVANLEDGAEGMVSAQSATFVLEADDEVVGHGAVGGCGSVLLVTRKHGIVSLAANQLNKNPAVYQVTEVFNNYLQDPSSLPQRPLPRMQPASLSKAVVDCSLAMIDRLPLLKANCRPRMRGTHSSFPFWLPLAFWAVCH